MAKSKQTSSIRHNICNIFYSWRMNLGLPLGVNLIFAVCVAGGRGRKARGSDIMLALATLTST